MTTGPRIEGELVVLVGGPLSAMWFTAKEWEQRRASTEAVRSEFDPPGAGACLRYERTTESRPHRTLGFGTVWQWQG